MNDKIYFPDFKKSLKNGLLVTITVTIASGFVAGVSMLMNSLFYL